jgi:hypothetical protein
LVVLLVLLIGGTGVFVGRFGTGAHAIIAILIGISDQATQIKEHFKIGKKKEYQGKSVDNTNYRNGN